MFRSISFQLYNRLLLAIPCSFPLPWQSDKTDRSVDVMRAPINFNTDFLNGYRGILALIVVIGHMGHHEQPLLDYFSRVNRTISVYGFFVLSAYLLTYRLLKELLRVKTWRLRALIVIKYAIRRFFRIYVVIILFLAFFKILYPVIGIFDRSDVLYEDTWWNVFTMKQPGAYMLQLWTLKVEIKYYFCIPVICLLFVYLFDPKHYIYPFVVLLVIALCNEYFNFLGLTFEALQWDNHENTGMLYFRFALFFYGSLAGIFIFIMENSPSVVCFIRRPLCRDLISFACVLIFYYVSVFRTTLGDTQFVYTRNLESLPSLLWSVFIVLMILGQPNFMTNFFNSCDFFSSSGKYSFGIYLWHVAIALHIRYNMAYEKRFTVNVVFVTIAACYFIGYLFFCLIEEPLMKIANKLCKKIDRVRFFHEDKEYTILQT